MEDFEAWWENEGVDKKLDVEKGIKEYSYRISKEAWSNSQYKERERSTALINELKKSVEYWKLSFKKTS